MSSNTILSLDMMAPPICPVNVSVFMHVLEKSLLATYIHCNILDKLKNFCMFFQKSLKRNGILELVVSKGVGEETKRKALLDLCRTR